MAATDSLHVSVGQLITGKVSGVDLDAEQRQLITEGTMSGVTLFKENARDLNQLVVLVDNLIRLGGPEFLIAVDQEGGAVQRFDDVLTPLPSPMALAACGNEDSVRSLMSMSGRQLRLLGVNCCLAPVLDINSNPRNPIIGTRSFGANRTRVIELGQIVAAAYLEEGVLPVAKHFPGHGDTFEDSHLKLAVVNAEQTTLDERELYPFVQTKDKMPAMLIAHVWLSAIEAERLPASLSYRVTQELLRNQIGYDGFLLSDDMPVMKAIIDNWGLEDAAVLSINAGLDNLLISGSADQIRAVHETLYKAVQSGTISEERLHSALRRRKKALSLCRHDRPQSLGEREKLLASEIESGSRLAADVSSKAVAVVRGRAINPFSQPDDWILVVPDHPRYPLNLKKHLLAITGGGATVQELRYSLDPQAEEIEKILTATSGKNCLLLTFRALLNKGQLHLAKRLADHQDDGLVVATDVPYELFELEQFRNCLATFDPSELAMQSLAQVLTGKVNAQGRLSAVIG